MSVCLSVCVSTWNNSAFNGPIFMKFDIYRFFENLLRKPKFRWNLTRITFTSNEGLWIFMIISRSVLLRMWNVSDKSCRKDQNTHFTFNNFFSENSAIYEIMWKNMVERDRQHMAIWRMHFACWTPKATHTHAHTHTLSICNTPCFSIATNVARTRLNITLYLNWLLLLNVISDNVKAIPLQAWAGPEGSRILRLQDFKTVGTWR